MRKKLTSRYKCYGVPLKELGIELKKENEQNDQILNCLTMKQLDMEQHIVNFGNHPHQKSLKIQNDLNITIKASGHPNLSWLENIEESLKVSEQKSNKSSRTIIGDQIKLLHVTVAFVMKAIKCPPTSEQYLLNLRDACIGIAKVYKALDEAGEKIEFMKEKDKGKLVALMEWYRYEFPDYDDSDETPSCIKMDSIINSIKHAFNFKIINRGGEKQLVSKAPNTNINLSHIIKTYTFLNPTIQNEMKKLFGEMKNGKLPKPKCYKIQQKIILSILVFNMQRMECVRFLLYKEFLQPINDWKDSHGIIVVQFREHKNAKHTGDNYIAFPVYAYNVMKQLRNIYQPEHQYVFAPYGHGPNKKPAEQIQNGQQMLKSIKRDYANFDGELEIALNGMHQIRKIATISGASTVPKPNEDFAAIANHTVATAKKSYFQIENEEAKKEAYIASYEIFLNAAGVKNIKALITGNIKDLD
uniref:Uncharacterized protein n=1 Tax=Panagrolaimus superbus TaxID=310955 RepID=A0A914YZW5_9BILA